MSNASSNDDQQIDKNAPYRSTRRAAHQDRAKNARTGKQRRIIVRSELRDQPDVRKIAKAIIAMAMAEAQREAQAQAEQATGDSQESANE